MAKLGLRSQNTPQKKRYCRNGNNRRHEITRNHICEFLNGRTTTLGFRDHLNNLSQQRFGTDAFGAQHKRPRTIHSPANYSVTCMFLNRNRLPGDHRFINRTSSIKNYPVNGHSLTGAHAQKVTYLYQGQRNVLFAAVGANPTRGFGREPEECFDSSTGPTACTKFEYLAQKYQRCNHRGCFKVYRHIPGMIAKGCRKRLRQKRGYYAE